MSHLSFNHLTDTQFEEFCYELLAELGFTNISWRKGTGFSSSPSDRGRDIECQRLVKEVDGNSSLEVWFVECKHYQQGVPPDKIQGALSWATSERPAILLIITSNFLSNATKDYLENYTVNNKPYFRIKYWERPDLERLTHEKAKLLRKYKIVDSSIARDQLDQIIFIRACTDFEKALRTTLLIMDELKSEQRLQRVLPMWGDFAHQFESMDYGHGEVVSKAISIWYDIDRGNLATCMPDELISLTRELDVVTGYVRDYPVSINILPQLKEKYAYWLHPDITSVRIIQKSRTVFLEITSTTSSENSITLMREVEEKVTRVDLGRLLHDMDEPIYLTKYTAQQNADLFVNKPFSTTELFTPEGCEALHDQGIFDILKSFMREHKR